MENKEGLCEAEVKKNLVLAETGGTLTLPLLVLNRSCKFKKEWDRIQNIWHGSNTPKEVADAKQNIRRQRPENKIKIREYMKKYMKEYNQIPENKIKVQERMKKYNQRPENKIKVRERMKEYNQRPENKIKNRERMKEYYQKSENKIKILEYMKEYNQKPEVKAKMKEYYKMKKALENKNGK